MPDYFSPLGLQFAATALSIGWLVGMLPGTPAIGQEAGRPGSPPAAAAESTVKLPPVLGQRRAGDDWPQFLGPNRDGRSRETGLNTDWKNRPPRLVWRLPLGESYSMGVTSRGRYIQFDRQDNDGVVTCLNAETGERLWEYREPYTYTDMYGYNSGPRCSPIVDGPHVFTYGVTGLLTCLRLADGQLVWKVDTAQQFGVVQNFFGVGSAPVIYGDLLIAMVGGSPPESQQLAPGQLDRVVGNGTGIVAFRKQTGQVVYKITDELASYASLQLAQYGGRDWCFAFARDALVAFDPATGKVDFRFPWRDRKLESVNAATPVVFENRVLISETYGPGAALLEFRPGAFDVVWKDRESPRNKILQCHWCTPVLDNGFLYASSGRHTQNAVLKCVEWKSGAVKWSEPDLTRGSLLSADGHLIFLGEDGALKLMRANPERYELVSELDWSRVPGAAAGEQGPSYPAWAPPILSHGLLYVRGNDALYALELIPASGGR